MRTRQTQVFVFLLVVLLLAVAAAGQSKITSPKQQFGFNLGDDYQLTNYVQLTEYWKKLAQQSDRMKLVEIGKTAEGRPMLMAIITSPENHKKLDRYKEISRRLALAEGLTDDQARALAAEGKAVVWIDGGLHATEVLGAQQLMELVYQMVSLNDPETMRFLKDDILLAVCVNPDGIDLVSNWYMREPEPTKRSTAGVPRLYQKYVGHDNNRDFYMTTQPETEAINRIFYHEWFPQIVYNHHQTGPPGTVLFAPPFRDPFNYYHDPLVPLGIDLVGAAMHNRFAVEGKPGATTRSGAPYSTWWNGGLRSTTGFHNMLGLLTETIGNPTPMEIPFLPTKTVGERRSGLSDCAAEMALSPVSRLLDHCEPRGARCCFKTSRGFSVQHLSHGQELNRARQSRQLDHSPQGAGRGASGDREGCSGPGLKEQDDEVPTRLEVTPETLVEAAAVAQRGVA